MMIRLSHATLSAALLLAACESQTADCTDMRRAGQLPAPLVETSGIAMSSFDPDVIWAHNDSEGSPTLHAIRSDGSPIADIALPDAGTQFDWEDIAIGPCDDGRCIYIADIGDNLHDRHDRAILRLSEPDPSARSVTGMSRFPIAYPDGPEDAEAIFVMPDATIYIITKGRSRRSTLYRYPPPLRPERVVLEHVQVIGPDNAQLPDFVTGADASTDGSLIVVRTYSHLTFHRFDGDTLVAVPPRIDLTPLAEPQGEAVALRGDGTIVLATESGLTGGRPFLSVLRCEIP